MTDISPARADIQIEETQYRSSVSEFTANKIGGSINFINKYQQNIHGFHMNAQYTIAEGSTGTDGVFPCLYNMELVGLSMYHGAQGLSGVTEIDIHWLSGGTTDNGTIFSVTPTVLPTAVDGSYMIYDVLAASSIVLPTGMTAPTLSKTTFDAGDALRLDLPQAMVGAKDFSFYIHFRAIN